MSVVVYFATFLDIYMSKEELIQLSPTATFAWLALPVLLFAFIQAPFDKPMVSSFLSCWLPLFTFLFLGLFALFLRESYTLPSGDGDKASLYPILDFGVFLVGCLIGAMGIQQRVKRFALYGGLILTTAGVWIDVLIPGSFSTDESRASGIALNPNIAASVAVYFMTCLLSWDDRRLKISDGIILSVGFLTVLATLSRSGLVLFLFIAAAYAFRRENRTFRLISWCCAGIGALIALSPLLYIPVTEMIPPLRSEWGRKLFFLERGSGLFGSDDERFSAMRHSMELIQERPFQGWGTGFTYGMAVGPHNSYLSRWIDNGIFGALAYIVFLASLLRVSIRNRNWESTILSLLTILFGLFSHNVLEDRAFLLLTALSLASGIRRQKSAPPPLPGTTSPPYPASALKQL